jgi:hypothetical protein
VCIRSTIRTTTRILGQSSWNQGQRQANLSYNRDGPSTMCQKCAETDRLHGSPQSFHITTRWKRATFLQVTKEDRQVRVDRGSNPRRLSKALRRTSPPRPFSHLQRSTKTWCYTLRQLLWWLAQRSSWREKKRDACTKYSRQFTTSMRYYQILKSGNHMYKNYSTPSWSPLAGFATILKATRLLW